MSSTPFRLADEHLEAAKTIALENRRRRSCKVCYDRGWVGLGQDNTIVLCHKCVDQEKALMAWKAYVEPVPELWEQYKDMFQEAEPDEDAGKE